MSFLDYLQWWERLFSQPIFTSVLYNVNTRDNTENQDFTTKPRKNIALVFLSVSPNRYACVLCYADDSTFCLIRRLHLLYNVNGPPLYIQFCFKGNVIYEGTDVIDTHSLLLLPYFGLRLFNIGETNAGHFFGSMDKLNKWWWTLIIIDVKLHVYVKRQTRICTTWPSFPFTCRLLFITSTHKLVISRIFLFLFLFF